MSKKHKNAPSVIEQAGFWCNNYLTNDRGLSSNTIRSYKATFRLLVIFFYEKKKIHSNDITYEMLNQSTIREFLTWLQEERNCSDRTRNQRLAAIASFAKYSQNIDFDAAACFQTAVLRTPMKKTTPAERSYFTPEEIKIILDLPDVTDRYGYRDFMILTILYATAVRAQELCDITMENLRYDSDRYRLHIVGKGRKARNIKLSKAVSEYLKKYIQKMNLYNDQKRHLFSSQTHEKMSISCVEAIVNKYVKRAKEKHPDLFQNKKYTVHSFRHSTAVHMLEANVPITVIQCFLGHSSIQVTEIYAKISPKAMNDKISNWNEEYWKEYLEEAPANSGNEESIVPDFLK